MTDEEIIEVVSVLKANDKTMKDNGISDNLWGKAVECIMFLQSENAALRERLSGAVKFPCKLGDKLYYVNEYLDIPKINEYTVTAFTILPECIKIYVGTGDYFLPDDNVCFTPEAAEARLAELKGGKE